MSKQNKHLKRNILIDEPATADSFNGQGHDRTAAALASAISEFDDQDRAIGLDGPWGSGKSSVVEIARGKLKQQAQGNSIDYRFFTYDIWKSQGAAFRRSFLEHFLDWARTEFPRKKSRLEEVEKKVKGKTRRIDTNNRNILDWYGILVIAFLPFLPLYYFWSKSVFDGYAKVDSESSFLGSAPFVMLILFLIGTLVWAGVRFLKSRGLDDKLSFKEAISQTLLISSKQYEDQIVTQHIRETDPNDFEFQKVCREVLSIIQTPKRRVVIILDNIDRLPREEIMDHWAMARAVFTSGGAPLERARNGVVTVILPYDRHLIEAALDRKKTGPETAKAEEANHTNEMAISSLSSRELFSKTFDEVLFVAPPVMSNSREFFLEKVAQALPELKGDEGLFRVYSVFNKMLQGSGGTATPRQIIGYINELSSLYVLHDGMFSLPTIAVYIAYRDHLEHTPSSLSDPDLIDERIRAAANDKDLDKNLTALLFNVSPDLSFQLLLDSRISAALVAPSARLLLELSNSPGFDLRVNDVLLNNAGDMVRDSAFAVCVTNCVELLGAYQGAARKPMLSALIDTFSQVEKLALEEEQWSPYLSLLPLLGPADQSKLATGVVQKSANWLSSEEEVIRSEGKLLSVLADKLLTSLDGKAAQDFTSSLSNMTLPQDPEFLTGFAEASHGRQVTLRDFAKPKVVISEENEGFFEKEAKSNPASALSAFAELNAVSILDEERLAAIATAIIEKLTVIDGEEEGFSQNHLALLSAVWNWTHADNRSGIDLASVFQSDNFYDRLQVISATGEQAGLAHALLLAKNHVGGADFDETVSANATEALNWFKSYFNGEELIAPEDVKAVAERVTQSLRVTSWIGWSAAAPENGFLSAVVSRALSAHPIPRISFSTLISNYVHLEQVLEDDLPQFLSRYAAVLDTKNVATLTLDKCPKGLITAAKATDKAEWQPLFDKVEELLGQVSISDWRSLISEGQRPFHLLVEAQEELNFTLDEQDFRSLLVELIVDVLNGEANLTVESSKHDKLLKLVPQEFHADVVRRIRDGLASVTGGRLVHAKARFPSTLTMLIGYGDRITAQEKDAIVRHLLCPALEAAETEALTGFLSLGRPKISSYISSSEESTRSLLDGALAKFGKSGVDRGLVQSVTELIRGKRKAKSILDIFFGTGE